MLKYVSKFALDILPSVVATIIGAYIVNHYIVTRPGAAAPVAAAVSTAEPKAEAKAAPEAVKVETSADVANIPEPGVRAKGISEKAILERSAVEKPAEKSADRPAETASIPVETKRHPAAPREKAVAKAVPAVVPVVAPVVAAPNPAPVEAAVAPDAPRDANDLARAAIERLRANDGVSRAQETARLPDAPRLPDASRVADAPLIVSAPPVRPLPPPIMVSTPASEAFDATTGSSRIDDPRRPTPPADIPASQPLDLHAEAVEPSTHKHSNVAEDMLLAAKSVFHAVLPNSSAK
jgi:hypothetical protein